MARAFSGVNIRSGRPRNLLSYRDLRINSSCRNKRMDSMNYFPAYNRIRLFWSVNSLWGRQLMLFLFKRLKIMLMRQGLSRTHVKRHIIILSELSLNVPILTKIRIISIIIITTTITKLSSSPLSDKMLFSPAWLRTHIICRLARPVRADWGSVASWLSYRILTVWIIICINSCYHW